MENINTVLRIPFDYEELMQDSSDGEDEPVLDELAKDVSNETAEPGTEIKNVSEDNAIVHNSETCSDVLVNTVENMLLLNV